MCEYCGDPGMKHLYDEDMMNPFMGRLSTNSLKIKSKKEKTTSKPKIDI
ncbi:hypothetical protein [Kordia sp.]|nr:hypothetical protein [Kordia sp.]MCH2194612.1 hypothetical protein [Kordia sp.]